MRAAFRQAQERVRSSFREPTFDEALARLLSVPVPKRRTGKGPAVRLDMTGQEFGRWTVLGMVVVRRQEAGKAVERQLWECRCQCGATTFLKGYVLRAGRSTRCVNCAAKLKARKAPPAPRELIERMQRFRELDHAKGARYRAKKRAKETA